MGVKDSRTQGLSASHAEPLLAALHEAEVAKVVQELSVEQLLEIWEQTGVGMSACLGGGLVGVWKRLKGMELRFGWLLIFKIFGA